MGGLHLRTANNQTQKDSIQNLSQAFQTQHWVQSERYFRVNNLQGLNQQTTDQKYAQQTLAPGKPKNETSPTWLAPASTAKSVDNVP